MNYRLIDWERYPRRAHFEYFHAMPDPYAGVTAQVELTPFFTVCRRDRLPFFLSFLYCAGRAANAVPQLRQRIVDGRPGEFSTCDTSHTVMREEGTYSYCRLNCMQPFEDYLPAALTAQAQAKACGGLDDGEDALSLLFVSSLPWINYAALRQPTPVPADSNPRLTWGRYGEENGKILMPVTLLVNHALVDGSHIAQFYAALDEALARFSPAAASELIPGK